MPKGVTLLLLFFRSSNTSKRSKFSARVHLRFKIASDSFLSPLEFISPIPFRATVTRIATARGGLVSYSLRARKGTCVHELQLDYELESSFLLAKSERGAGKLTTLLRGE